MLAYLDLAELALPDFLPQVLDNARKRAREEAGGGRRRGGGHHSTKCARADSSNQIRVSESEGWRGA